MVSSNSNEEGEVYDNSEGSKDRRSSDEGESIKIAGSVGSESNESVESDSSDSGESDSSVDNKTVNVYINVDKRDKHLEDEVTAIDLLFKSLSDDDQALVDEYDTAFQFWAYLCKKYTHTDVTAPDMYMTRIQTSTFDSENTIVGSWEKPKDYRRKLVSVDVDINGAYQHSALLLTLTRLLLTRFRTTIDTLNT
ncbi:hypothetical protein PTNB73_06294 [Pyrenophora teres f. teres]|nr:hypothetical protein HRS9122_06051 [Pyrenophora teres f. teres]KAE8865406.1 hypothetical protein PTNB73_06294 [Pyrenophora teres f. teres]